VSRHYFDATADIAIVVVVEAAFRLMLSFFPSHTARKHGCLAFHDTSSNWIRIRAILFSLATWADLWRQVKI
jgi:hypothetical protein